MTYHYLSVQLWMCKFSCVQLCVGYIHVCVCVSPCLRKTDKDKEAWNDNAAVQRQRMWSQIKATRLPLPLASSSCCFSGPSEKGSTIPFFLFYFSLCLLVPPASAKKRGGRMQYESVMEGLRRAAKPFLAVGPAVLVKCHYRQRC